MLRARYADVELGTRKLAGAKYILGWWYGSSALSVTLAARSSSLFATL